MSSAGTLGRGAARAMTAALVLLGLYLGWLLLYSYSAGLDLQNPAELRR